MNLSEAIKYDGDVEIKKGGEWRTAYHHKPGNTLCWEDGGFGVLADPENNSGWRPYVVYDLDWWEMIRALGSFPDNTVFESDNGKQYTAYILGDSRVRNLWGRKYRRVP